MQNYNQNIHLNAQINYRFLINPYYSRIVMLHGVKLCCNVKLRENLYGERDIESLTVLVEMQILLSLLQLLFG